MEANFGNAIVILGYIGHLELRARRHLRLALKINHRGMVGNNFQRPNRAFFAGDFDSEAGPGLNC